MVDNAEVIVCPECGVANELSSSFCMICGFGLSELAGGDGNEIRYVGFWRRFLAWMIDTLILISIGVMLMVLAVMAYVAGLGEEHLGAFYTLYCIISLVYIIGFWVWRGQTLGKMALGVKIISSDGRPVTLGRAILRYFGYMVSQFILYIGYLMIAWDHRKQGLHDKIAGTVVVRKNEIILADQERWIYSGSLCGGGERGATSKWYVLAPLIALAGGAFGIVGAIMEESNYGWYFLPFIAAPIVEEAVKPCGVYLLLGRWPQALHGRLHTAFLAALGGLAFASIENIIYLELYFPDHTQDLALWRWTVCVLVHMSCSFIVGLGINERLSASIRGDIPFLKGNRKFFFTAMALHGVYNLLAFFVIENVLDLNMLCPW